ncbi:glycine-rich domain-containing protein [Ralstonia solanacearum]|uniref:glycine-rich domain-containing protein n=1 Tax=Ralstonia solanacearum TaxID=305 RepID=UPI0014303251|nr:hypothetical protein [Ralstonia solanacearum]
MPDSLPDFLAGGPTAPGAGGAGAGAVGDNAIGGDGGGGGDLVRANISEEEFAALRAAGFERLELTVGEGGLAGRNPGEHGNDGSDTFVHFVTKDGRILRTIRAAGGAGARASTQIPPGTREVTPTDLAAGLSVSTLMVAEAIRPRDGVVSLLNGAWSFSLVPNIPTDIQWDTLCVLCAGASDRSTPIVLFATLTDPKGTEVLRLPLPSNVSDPSLATTVYWAFPLRFTVSMVGVWNIRIVSGGFELAHLPVEIRLHLS